MNPKIFLLSKKIHRLLVLAISVLILFMAATGAMLKYSGFFSKYLPFLNLGLVRYLHSSLSLYFTAVLIFMGATGLYMYFFTLKSRATQTGVQGSSQSSAQDSSSEV